MKKSITWLIAVVVIVFLGIAALKLVNIDNTLIEKGSQSFWFSMLVIISALVDSINPCAFSVLLVTIAFLVSLGKGRGGILAIGSSYIIGIFIVYVLIGLGIIQALQVFNTPHVMARVGAILVILWGVIGLIDIAWQTCPIKLKIPQKAHSKIAFLMEKASMGTAFILGVLVGLFEFPCTGGPYLMILGLLHDKETTIQGFGYLLLYNLVFVLPLMVLLLVASNREVFDRVQSWRKENLKGSRLWTSIIMIALGFLILIFY